MKSGTVIKYDDASWHYDGDFPASSPREYGGIHIALFLKWCFVKGWAGDDHLAESASDVARVVDGTMSATDYLFRHCDGRLTEEDLNEEGNKFAAAYYGDNGLYFNDFVTQFGELMYQAPEEAFKFDDLAQILDTRLQNGVLTVLEEGLATH